MLGSDLSKVDHTLAVSPLVVVPCNNLHHSQLANNMDCTVYKVKMKTRHVLTYIRNMVAPIAGTHVAYDATVVSYADVGKNTVLT